MRRRYSMITTAVAAALLLSACGSASSVSQATVDKAVADELATQAAIQASDSPAPDASAESESDEIADASPSPSASSKPAKSESSSNVSTVNFRMPSFVGMTLQDAQDEVQERGIFFSVSHDLLASRSQFLDSNWKVCNQTPKVGSIIKGNAVDFEGMFDFGSVRLSEDCPS